MRQLAASDRKAFCELRRSYQRHRKTFTKSLARIPKEEFPPTTTTLIPDECWRSQDFLVQIYRTDGNQVRLSIVRTTLAADGSWEDGITWDEIQRIKATVGFSNEWAVEIFPPDDELVNVANIRHIWIVPAPEFAWRKWEA